MSTNFFLKYSMLELSQISNLHIELSSKCQAACPLCERNLYGYYERPDFPKINLTLEKIKKIFDNVEFTKMKNILYNGNFGDPCINPDLSDITEYFFNKFTKIQHITIMTNGGMHKPEWWFELGKRFVNYPLIVTFSIDGLEDTNHLYRVNVPYDKVMENARAFIAGGGHATWKWIEFKHNQHQVELAKARSKEYGFQKFEVSEHCRDDGYVKTGEDSFYLLEPADYKNVTFRMPQPEIKNDDYVAYENFRNSLSEFNVQDKLVSWKEDKTLDCHHLGWKSVYINSAGELYPCCFLGFFPNTYSMDRNQQLKDILKKYNNNLLQVDWATAIAWFQEIYSSWNKDTVEEGLVKGCLISCHSCNKK